MRKRQMMSILGLLAGCGDDSGTTVGPIGTTGGSGGVTFGSADDDDSGGAPAGCAEYPLPFPIEGVFTAYRENEGAHAIGPFNGSDSESGAKDMFCPNAPAFSQHSGPSYFYVYRPTAGGGSWPGGAEQKFPLVVFSPPNGGAPVDTTTGQHFYPWLERLAAEGFVVVAIVNPLGQSIAVRAQYVLCAMDWARTQWEHAGRVNCDVSLVGHSRGGGAVHALVEHLVDTDAGLKAVIGIAPAESSGDIGDIEAEPIHPSLAVPYFVLGGGNDDDPTGHFSRMYDMMGFEDPPGVMSRADVRVYT